MSTPAFLLALHRRLNLTRPRFETLSNFFEGDWQKAYQASISDWQKSGIERRAIEKFFGTPEVRSPLAEMELLQACGAQIITCTDPHYPDLWHHIAQAPALFFYRGNGENLNTKSLAVVGSRKMTTYGERIFGSVLQPVFERKITIVSGLAYGVDAAAHQLALRCKAPTVAVLGNGIDDVYPKRNHPLAQKILEQGGTIVSEYLPQTEARPEFFPQRNRLVVGLATGTVVVEAALKSGSLISARLANDMGRQVWAVPGDIFRGSSAGCNQLIFQGEASALTHAEFLLETLNLQNTVELQKIDLSSEEKSLLKILRQKNVWIVDELIAHLKVSTAEVSAQLITLELKGLIKTSADKVYVC